MKRQTVTVCCSSCYRLIIVLQCNGGPLMPVWLLDGHPSRGRGGRWGRASTANVELRLHMQNSKNISHGPQSLKAYLDITQNIPVQHQHATNPLASFRGGRRRVDRLGLGRLTQPPVCQSAGCVSRRAGGSRRRREADGRNHIRLK